MAYRWNSQLQTYELTASAEPRPRSASAVASSVDVDAFTRAVMTAVADGVVREIRARADATAIAGALLTLTEAANDEEFVAAAQRLAVEKKVPILTAARELLATYRRTGSAPNVHDHVGRHLDEYEAEGRELHRSAIAYIEKAAAAGKKVDYHDAIVSITTRKS